MVNRLESSLDLGLCEVNVRLVRRGCHMRPGCAWMTSPLMGGWFGCGEGGAQEESEGRWGQDIGEGHVFEAFFFI